MVNSQHCSIKGNVYLCSTIIKNWLEMPIGKDEWKDGISRETDEGKILHYLRSNSEKAFSQMEIAKAIGYSYRNLVDALIGTLSVDVALKNLMKEGSIQARIIKEKIGEETYYKAV